MTETFRNRLSELVNRDGITAVASRYSVSESTVRRWRRGESLPRDAATTRSVVRRGRALTGAVIQERGADGRFRTVISDRNSIRAFQSIQRRQIELAEQRISQARSPAQRAFAQAQMEIARDQRTLVEYIQDWRSWKSELDFGLRDDWNEWRGSYEVAMGRA